MEFGDQLPDKNKKGEDITCAEISIHFDCAWEICRGGVVLLDHTCPQGLAEQSQSVDDFFKNLHAGSLVVVDLDASDHGGLNIELAGGYRVRTWPFADAPADDEVWRLLSKSGETEFVVRGSGISAV